MGVLKVKVNGQWVDVGTGPPVSMIAGTAAAATTSAAVETAAINTANVPASSASLLSIMLSLAATGTVAADIFQVFVKANGVAIWQSRHTVPSNTNLATPIHVSMPYSLAANTAVAITATLQRVVGTGTLAVGAVQNGNSLLVTSVPV